LLTCNSMLMSEGRWSSPSTTGMSLSHTIVARKDDSQMGKQAQRMETRRLEDSGNGKFHDHAFSQRGFFDK